MNVNEAKQISAGTRLGAMLLDHVFMTVIGTILSLPIIVSGVTSPFGISHGPANFDFMGGTWKYLSLFGFALYFCKDIVNGRSIAKRILKLQVVDNRTGQVATSLQCLVRNIFCALWFIEVFVAMANTSRRIGDRVAGTKLVPYDPALEQPKPTIGKLLLPLMISYGVMFGLVQLMPSTTIERANYVEASYNEKESKELEKLIIDSLGQYMTPDIRIYDSLKNRKLKYLSIILALKDNYIGDDKSYQQLHQTTTGVIYSKYTTEAFAGRIQYYYGGSGQLQVRESYIGTYILK